MWPCHYLRAAHLLANSSALEFSPKARQQRWHLQMLPASLTSRFWFTSSTPTISPSSSYYSPIPSILRGSLTLCVSLVHSSCLYAFLLPVCFPPACINRAVLTCIETETLCSTTTHCTKVCCIFNKEDQDLGWRARLPLWHRLSHGTLPHIIELLCGVTLQCVYIHIHTYICIYKFTCVCVCTCVYICKHAHARTHTLSFLLAHTHT